VFLIAVSRKDLALAEDLRYAPLLLAVSVADGRDCF
jgi:hypothetical protein